MKTVALIIVVALSLVSKNVLSQTDQDTSLTILEQDLTNNNIVESRPSYDKALSLYKSNQFAEAEKIFLEVIAETEKDNDKEIFVHSLHYLGQIESWKTNFRQSIHYHKKALTTFYEMNRLEAVAKTNSFIASGFKSLGEYDSTVIYYKKNLKNPKYKDFENSILKSYQGLAGVYTNLSNYKNAYHYLQEGIKYAEERNSKSSLAKLYFTAGQMFLINQVNKDIALEYLVNSKIIFEDLNQVIKLNWVKLIIGDVQFASGNDSLAMANYKNIITNLPKDNYPIVSRAYFKIAMVYKRQNEHDSALVYLKKSINSICDTCPEIEIINSLFEAGNLFLVNGNPAKAFKLFTRARKIAVQSGLVLKRAISSEVLANYYKTISEIDSSIYYLNEAYALSKQLGLPQRIKSSAEALSKVYYSKGAFKASSDYLKIANQMNDSLAVIEKSNEIAKLEMRFEIKKREEERLLEAQLLQSELDRQKLIRNTSIAGAIIFSLIGLASLLAYRSKRRDNKLLAKQKSEIQEVSKQLQEAGIRRLNFFTNISHEIRTPLTLIKSLLEKSINTDDNIQSNNGQLQTALNNTNKLKDLVNQILDLQKLDENKLGLDLSKFELINFCQDIVSSFEEYSHQCNCRFNFKSNVGNAFINFDQRRLQSIITNLLSNAFKFNKENGTVNFIVDLNQNLLNIKISDTGIGISEEHQKKLGDRYYQIENSNSSVEGTGLGLAYVKELVELMKGNLIISSIENEGTTVSISLPCNEIEIQNETPIESVIKARPQSINLLNENISDNSKNLPSILIVEDNYELRSFLHDLFTPTYHIICAKDGKEGEELALKYIPDLIISDIMMPGMKGNELCKTLKNDINTSHITIILFTAKGTPESIVDGYDCGADDYIVKPFDSDLLLKKVKNILSTIENVRKQFSFADMEKTNLIYSEFDKKFLKDCLSIVKENISNNKFTVELLAEEMNVHRRTLSRKFNSLTGKSPTDLIRHTRMSQAAALIRNKKYRVNEVAFMIGYEDTSRFSQAFKQFHGVPPSSYS